MEQIFVALVRLLILSRNCAFFQTAQMHNAFERRRRKGMEGGRGKGKEAMAGWLMPEPGLEQGPGVWP